MKNIIKNSMKKRKGFSLVELVVVILIIAILAVAVFAGGSAAIKKSQVSRTTSDLHNFSIAIESAVNETPSVANMENNGDFGDLLTAINNNLPADYRLEAATTIASGNLTLTQGDADANYTIYKSAKTDAWGNNYYAILDCGERHAKGQSDFFVTVVSAGPNAQTVVSGAIEADDIFLLVQYSDGDVSAATYNVADNGLKVTTGVADGSASYNVVNFATAPASKTVTIKGTAGTMLYQGGSDNTSYTGSALPVNF